MPINTPFSRPALSSAAIVAALPSSSSSTTASSTLHNELAWLSSTSYLDCLSAGLKHKLHLPRHDTEEEEAAEDDAVSLSRVSFDLSDTLPQALLERGWEKLNATKWATPLKPAQRHAADGRDGAASSSAVASPPSISFKPPVDNDYTAALAPSVFSRPNSLPPPPFAPTSYNASATPAVPSSVTAASYQSRAPTSSTFDNSSSSLRSFPSSTSPPPSAPPHSAIPSALFRGSLLSDEDDADFAALLADEQGGRNQSAQNLHNSSAPTSALPASAFHHPAASASSYISYNTPQFAAPSSYTSPSRSSSSMPPTSINPSSYPSSSSYSGLPPTLSASTSYPPRTVPSTITTSAYTGGRTSSTDLVRMPSPTLTTVPMHDLNSEWKSTAFPWTASLYEQNKSTFGNHSFRPLQREIMNATLSGRDVFVLMPTGGGKSLCYQLTAIVRDGLTVVFSPLLSLIQDQVTALHVADVPAATLNSATSSEDNPKIWRDVHQGFLKLLYITPEKFHRSAGLLRLLHDVEAKGKLQAFVIDEAHCTTHNTINTLPALSSSRCTLSQDPDRLYL